MSAKFDDKYIPRLERFADSTQWGGTMAMVVHRVIKSCSLPAGSSVRHLDVGCGTGKLCRWIASGLLSIGMKADTVGVDVNKAAIVKAASFGRGRYFLVKDYLPWPVSAGSVDSATLCYVLGHCDSPKDTLARIFLALKPGGLLFIVSTNPLFDAAMAIPNLFNGYRTDDTIQHHWTLTGLCRFVSKEGFVVTDTARVGERFRYLPNVESLRAYNFVACKKPL